MDAYLQTEVFEGVVACDESLSDSKEGRDSDIVACGRPQLKEDLSVSGT